MKKLVEISRLNPPNNILHINWFLHNVCNYHCSYCEPLSNSGTQTASTYDQVLNFLEMIENHYGEKDFIHFSFTGGEPTIWPSFERLCDYLYKKGHKIGMTSNGSREIQFWKSIVNYFSWIGISYHPEKSNNAHLLKVLKILQDDVETTIRIMMHPDPDLWSKSIKFATELQEAKNIDNVVALFVPLRDDFWEGRMMEYTRDQSDFLNSPSIDGGSRKNNFDSTADLWNLYEVYDDDSINCLNSTKLIINNEHCFKGWECHAGMDLLFIDHQQDIFRSTCKIGPLIGNVEDQHLNLPSGPIICPLDHCVCETDIETKKIRLERKIKS